MCSPRKIFNSRNRKCHFLRFPQDIFSESNKGKCIISYSFNSFPLGCVLYPSLQVFSSVKLSVRYIMITEKGKNNKEIKEVTSTLQTSKLCLNPININVVLVLVYVQTCFKRVLSVTARFNDTNALRKLKNTFFSDFSCTCTQGRMCVNTRYAPGVYDIVFLAKGHLHKLTMAPVS